MRDNLLHSQAMKEKLADQEKSSFKVYMKCFWLI